MPHPSTIVVAGDVCIDWLSVPLDPASFTSPNAPRLNWELRGGRRMYARHGGAWLTAHFTAAAADAAAPRAYVFGPQRYEQHDLDAISPDRLIHSLVTLDRFANGPGRDAGVLRVKGFEGFAGPSDPTKMNAVPLVDNTPSKADIVVLDDAGNGFRSDRSRWPDALRHKSAPAVLYKLREPLAGADLGASLRTRLGRRTIVLLNLDELRSESETRISRALSWERTAAEAMDAVHRSPQLLELLDFAHVIIPIGMEGALHLETGPDRSSRAVLWYCPDRIEGDIVATTPGQMTGMSSAFTAALAHAMSQANGADRLSAATVSAGIQAGMRAMWRLLRAGFGACKRNEPANPPLYPGETVFAPLDDRDFALYSAPLTPYPRRMERASIPRIKAKDREAEIEKRLVMDLAEFRGWSILRTTRGRSDASGTHGDAPYVPYSQLAERVVREGLQKALPHVPVAKFGGLELVDRQEIEGYRAIRNIMREFLHDKRPPRPLCLAVFGPPGAGKSFGVIQVAKALAAEQRDAGDIETYPFNVSQWESPRDLAHALHHVRDSALRQNVPLVFFDEFDSSLDSQELAWLKHFLAPMQDGIFSDGAFTHILGKAIFVFAGGTSVSYADFYNKAFPNKSNLKAVAKARSQKAPDFLSRLRGYVDVQGIGDPAGVQLLRRAVVLRSFLERKCRHAVDPRSGQIRVRDAVLRAFLNVPSYLHGVRSIEAMLDMSRLEQATDVIPSLLPPASQIELHAPATEFAALLDVNLDLGDRCEDLARKAHQRFVNSMRGKRDPDHPSMRPWEELIPLNRNSNREQAAHVPVKLAAVGCRVAPRAQASRAFRFSTSEVETLARMEHVRWVEERRPVQPEHTLLIPWEQLTRHEKAKDYRYVRGLPADLTAVGLGIVRLD